MIVHIPHDGRWLPSGLDRFDGTMTPLRDFGARQVFEGGHGRCLTFPVDRLVCDVERFKEGEPMEDIGMGICYERDADLRPLREVTPEMRAEVIRRFYDPHHARLAKMVDDEIGTFGRCLIIDGHTFSAIPRGYEPSRSRPQIDVGHDGDFPSVTVANLIIDCLRQWYEILVNEPFSGSLRPLDRIGDSRVASVMIEVRQDLDMELARKRVQGAMALAERRFYGDAGHAGRGGPLPSDRPSAGDAFSEAERHRRLDALSEKYGYLRGFQDLVYGSWDDETLGSKGLATIEAKAPSFVEPLS